MPILGRQLADFPPAWAKCILHVPIAYTMRMHARRLGNRRPAADNRTAFVLLALTLAFCISVLLFRSQLQNRWWAWKIAHATSPTERAAALTMLCNTADAGRWGLGTLLADPRPEIRQYGVIALQSATTAWARDRLATALGDPDPDVRQLAAFGLARLHDDRVIPQLRAMYTSGSDVSAAAACLVLQRMGTPASTATLAALANVPATPPRRAALIDALESVGSTSAARALLTLLDDPRPCDAPPPGARIMRKLAPLLAARGLTAASAPASRPAHTVAERAALALARITGLRPGFSSDLPEPRRHAAAGAWRAWITAHQRAATPSSRPADLPPP